MARLREPVTRFSCPSVLSIIITVLSALLAAALPGCGGGGGGGGSGSNSAESGEVSVALMDANSDRLERFRVDVRSIDLVRRDGTVVHTLPTMVRVDFSEIVEVAEILNPATVPGGVYERVELTLDFDEVEALIAGQTGPATVLGEDGQPLHDLMTVTLELESGRPLVVAPGVARVLTLDFQLEASLDVDTAANTITVSPVLLADIDLERPLVHRVRGLLESVDVAGATFELAVRPFRAAFQRFGGFRVTTDGETHFEVNGVALTGRAGLVALSRLPLLTHVVARGRFRLPRGVFDADEVLAGSSVPGGDLDVVSGLVSRRSGTTLNLIATKIERRLRNDIYNAEVVIEIDPAATRVTKDMSAEALDTDAISVGQRIAAFGSLTASTGSFRLEPTRRVRLLLTRIAGEVKSAGAGALVLDLQRFGNRLPAVFDFTGTGAEGSDADPESYEVAAPLLDLEGLEAGAPVRAAGFVTPFGAAPPDLEAQTVVDVSGAVALLHVVWDEGSGAQFKGVSAAGLLLDLAGSPVVHHVERAGVLTDLTEKPEAAVAPGTGERPIFVLRNGARLALFGDFAAFAAELDRRLRAGDAARRLFAAGSFDDATGTLGADLAVVALD